MKQRFHYLLLVASLMLLQFSALTGQSAFPLTTPEAAGMSAERLERLDHILKDYVDNKGLPGVAAIIVRDGKLVWSTAYGYRDIESEQPLQLDDIFRIASQSKAITALAVMMLWEEGKFFLDDPVSKFIPEFAQPVVLETFNAVDTTYTTKPAGSEITIRQLLTHTSGLDYPSIGSPEFRAIYAKAGIPSGIGSTHPVLQEAMLRLAALPLKHAPGERWTYGLNSDVLGYLVEIWSGMPFDRFLRERIFEPLGMEDTWFYLPENKHDRLVSLYAWKDGQRVQAKQVDIFDGVDPDFPLTEGQYFSGGAGLSSTVEDYARFLQLFLNGGTFNGVQLLSRKTVELMLANQVGHLDTFPVSLGFGLETESIDHKSVLSIGSFAWGGAYNTIYWADPEEGLIGVLFTNVYQSPYGDISERFEIMVYQAIAD